MNIAILVIVALATGTAVVGLTHLRPRRIDKALSVLCECLTSRGTERAAMACSARPAFSRVFRLCASRALKNVDVDMDSDSNDIQYDSWLDVNGTAIQHHFQVPMTSLFRESRAITEWHYESRCGGVSCRTTIFVTKEHLLGYAFSQHLADASMYLSAACYAMGEGLLGDFIGPTRRLSPSVTVSSNGELLGVARLSPGTVSLFMFRTEHLAVAAGAP